MRILEAITPSTIGGAEVQFATTVRGFLKLGEEVVAFCPSGRPLVPYLERQGISPVTWKTWGKCDPCTLFRLAGLMKSRRIDVVHTHLSTASLLGCLSARLTGIPSIATVHGLSDARWYRYADEIIAVSEAVRNHLLAQNIPEGRIHVVHNGIPLDEYPTQSIEMAKRACNFDPSELRVGVFGRLAPEKGQAIALAAWAHVKPRLPKARLMLVGKGKSEGELHDLCRGLALGDAVEFPGFLLDPRQAMAACDLVLVPSLKEGLGLAAIEAMALQRPAVASETGGLTEVVVDGETGILVPPGDAKALADAILRLLEDPEVAAQLGRAGRKRVEEHFNAKSQILALRDVMRRRVGVG